MRMDAISSLGDPFPSTKRILIKKTNHRHVPKIQQSCLECTVCLLLATFLGHQFGNRSVFSPMQSNNFIKPDHRPGFMPEHAYTVRAELCPFPLLPHSLLGKHSRTPRIIRGGTMKHSWERFSDWPVESRGGRSLPTEWVLNSEGGARSLATAPVGYSELFRVLCCCFYITLGRGIYLWLGLW